MEGSNSFLEFQWYLDKKINYYSLISVQTDRRFTTKICKIHVLCKTNES